MGEGQQQTAEPFDDERERQQQEFQEALRRLDPETGTPTNRRVAETAQAEGRTAAQATAHGAESGYPGDEEGFQKKFLESDEAKLADAKLEGSPTPEQIAQSALKRMESAEENIRRSHLHKQEQLAKAAQQWIAEVAHHETRQTPLESSESPQPRHATFRSLALQVSSEYGISHDQIEVSQEFDTIETDVIGQLDRLAAMRHQLDDYLSAGGRFETPDVYKYRQIAERLDTVVREDYLPLQNDFRHKLEARDVDGASHTLGFALKALRRLLKELPSYVAILERLKNHYHVL